MFIHTFLVMDFTFGIITDGSNDPFIHTIIESIYNNHIPNYEIIIVGQTTILPTDKITILDFDESIHDRWITRKKNIIVEHAKYENVVLLHDYIQLNSDWYTGFLQFGNDFDWCVNRILNNQNERFRDYTLLPTKIPYLNLYYSPGDIDYYFYDNCLLPYDFENNIKTNKYMYISGSYFVIKKHVALKYPLDETFCEGRAEDVEFSKRLHANGIIIKCNKFSSVSFLKEKPSVHWEQEICGEMLRHFVHYCNIE